MARRAAGRLYEVFVTLLAAECKSKLYSFAVRESKSRTAATLLGPKLVSIQKTGLCSSYTTKGMC